MKKSLFVLLTMVLVFSMVFTGCKTAEETAAVKDHVEMVTGTGDYAGVEEAIEEAVAEAVEEAVVEEAVAEAVEEDVTEESVEEDIPAEEPEAVIVEEPVAVEPVEEDISEEEPEAVIVEEPVVVEPVEEDIPAEEPEAVIVEEPVAVEPVAEAVEEAVAVEPVAEAVEEAVVEEAVAEAVEEAVVEEAVAEAVEEAVAEAVEEAVVEEIVKSYDEYLTVDWNEAFVDLPTGIRMAYVQMGPEDGTPIVLLHGVTDGRVSWSQVAPQLADLGYKVIVPEYRGNGKTDKPEVDENGYTAEMIADDIVAFLDELGLDQVYLGGHSYGSMISQIVNLKAAEKLLGTILIDSTVNAATSEVLDWAENGDGEEYLGVHGYDEEGAMPDSFLVGWAENTNPDEAFQQATIEHLRQMPYECWYNLLHACHSFDNTEGISDTTGKVLVIWGTDDTIFPEADQNVLKEALANSEAEVTYVDIPGSHNIHWDSPETCAAVVNAIDEFIKSCEAPVEEVVAEAVEEAVVEEVVAEAVEEAVVEEAVVEAVEDAVVEEAVVEEVEEAVVEEAAAEAVEDAVVEEAVIEAVEEAAAEPVEEAPVEEIVAEAVEETAAENDIIILYTNDVHGAYAADPENGTLGYTTISAVKKQFAQETPYVALVDNGDAIQGEVIAAVSQGEYIIDFMNKAGYDVAALGNHEFDYGFDQLAKLAENADFQYVSCNMTYTGKGESKLSFLKPYVIKEFGSKKVAFVGVSTPNSIASSTPTFFQEDGEFVYGFSAGEKGKVLYDVVQNTVDAAKAEGADYVILMSHLGIEEGDEPYRSVDVIANTTGIDACLDGHSHSTIDQKSVANKDGKDVILTSTGTKCVAIGKLVITADGEISSTLLNEGLSTDPEFDEATAEITASFEEKMNEVVASTDVALYISDAGGIRMVRSRETNLGDLCADAYRVLGNAQIGLVNGGGVRANIEAGDITYGNIIAVHPFGNLLTVVKATGQQIIDALEWTSRNAQAEYKDGEGNALGESGAFLQVSGVKYTVDTAIESPCIEDDNGMFFGMIEDAPYRVSDVMVEDENGNWVEIDPDAEYTVASHNYLLKSGGDGTNMFINDEIILDESMSDYQILINYITENLNGNCSEYAEPAGRITVKGAEAVEEEALEEAVSEVVEEAAVEEAVSEVVEEAVVEEIEEVAVEEVVVEEVEAEVL